MLLKVVQWYKKSVSVYMLWFNFILVSIFIFFCFFVFLSFFGIVMLIMSIKQRKIKIEPRIKLNHNIHTSVLPTE